MGKWFWLLALGALTACKKQEPASSAASGDGTKAVAAAPATDAIVSGRVLFSGTAPPPRSLALDPTCGKLHTNAPPESDYRIGVSNGLADVLVYVKDVPAGAEAAPSGEPPVLDQKGCIYTPRVMGVMVNQKFRIRNSDPLLHNVHPLPKKNKEFNFAQPVQGQVNEKAFGETEIFVRFKCDVHPWMAAYVGVVPHRFFAVTDTNGHFRLPAGLPPGAFVLEAAHPKTGTVSQEIMLTTGEHKQIDFTISAPTQ
jgi:hypothetical protein